MQANDMDEHLHMMADGDQPNFVRLRATSMHWWWTAMQRGDAFHCSLVSLPALSRAPNGRIAPWRKLTTNSLTASTLSVKLASYWRGPSRPECEANPHYAHMARINDLLLRANMIRSNGLSDEILLQVFRYHDTNSHRHHGRSACSSSRPRLSDFLLLRSRYIGKP